MVLRLRELLRRQGRMTRAGGCPAWSWRPRSEKLSEKLGPGLEETQANTALLVTPFQEAAARRHARTPRRACGLRTDYPMTDRGLFSRTCIACVAIRLPYTASLYHLFRLRSTRGHHPGTRNRKRNCAARRARPRASAVASRRRGSAPRPAAPPAPGGTTGHRHWRWTVSQTVRGQTTLDTCTQTLTRRRQSFRTPHAPIPHPPSAARARGRQVMSSCVMTRRREDVSVVFGKDSLRFQRDSPESGPNPIIGSIEVRPGPGCLISS
jgi:hypothetical protein